MVKYLSVIMLVIALGAASLGLSKEMDIKIDGLYLTEPMPITNFSLVNNNGKSFSKENMKGHWTMLFFGFTHCPMVCPTTMTELNKMYNVLQKELPSDKLPQVVLISVDSERDTVEQLNKYVKSFNPNFLGARGDIKPLKDELHVYVEKMQTEGEGKNHYTVNHSAEIMVFNPDAKLQAFLSYPHHAEQMVKDYKLIIHG